MDGRRRQITNRKHDVIFDDTKFPNRNLFLSVVFCERHHSVYDCFEGFEAFKDDIPIVQRSHSLNAVPVLVWDRRDEP